MESFEKMFVKYDDTEKRIKEGIEKNRKGDFTIKLPFCTDGKARVKLKKHNFKFGCNCFMLGEMKDDQSKNAIYEEKGTIRFSSLRLWFLDLLFTVFQLKAS